MAPGGPRTDQNGLRPGPSQIGPYAGQNRPPTNQLWYKSPTAKIAQPKHGPKNPKVTRNGPAGTRVPNHVPDWRFEPSKPRIPDEIDECRPTQNANPHIEHRETTHRGPAQWAPRQ